MELGPAEILIVLLIVLLLFGGREASAAGASLGEAEKEFERGQRGDPSAGPKDESERS